VNGHAPTVLDDDVRAFHAWLKINAKGKACAKTARAIVRSPMLGFDARELRALAHRAIEMGILICADNDGYFVPTKLVEVDANVGRLRVQGIEMMTRAKALDALARQAFAERLTFAAEPYPSLAEIEGQ
jgi:hypothetical protein